MSIVFPQQRVPIRKKKSRDWYVNNAKYWITTATSQKSISDTVDNYNAANGIIPDKVFEYVLKPLSAEPGEDLPKLPGEIRDIDFITPIKEKNIGEYIDLPYQYTVKINDPDIVIKKNLDVAQAIQPILEQFIINKINEFQQTDVPSQPIGNIEEEVKKKKLEWVDERAIYASDLIEFINDLNGFEDKRLQGFFDWWATEEVYFYNYIINGNAMFDIISPLDAFPILAGKDSVEEGDGFLIKRRMSIFQISSFYGDKLTTKDREYLNILTSRLATGDMPNSIPAQVYKDIYGSINLDGVSTGDTNFTFNSDFIDEYIILFKTEIKKKSIVRLNPLGQLTESIEDESYEFNPELGDINEEDIWIEEIWKQVLLGDYTSGIYLVPEPVEVQIYKEDGTVYLPVVGKRGLLKHNFINPIPKRILPILALYRIINLQIERAIAKYKLPTELIPKGLLASQDGSVKANMFYLKADNTIIYDETKYSGRDVAKDYIVVGNTSASNFIRDLIDLRESLKAEAWELSNMNDARYGSAPASSTVRNNEQNLYRAKLGSILMTTVYNNVLAKQHKISCEFAKVAYIDGVSGSLFNRKDGTTRYFNIPGGELSNMQLGIFVANSVIEKQKLEEYKNLAFSAAQNGKDELAAEAIDGDSSSAIRQAIAKYAELDRQFQKEMKEIEGRNAQAVVEGQKEAAQITAQNKLDAIELEQNLITDRELKLAAMQNNNN